ncbi:MAG: TolC family protein [Halobacteriovoraceae bacterium]|nr:TolC family protein [Halobacteriovoraceae bacterium]
MKAKKLLSLFLLLSLSLRASENSILIDENVLKEYFEKGAPGVDEIEAALLSTKEIESSQLEAFSPTGYVDTNLSKSYQQSVNLYRPITKEAKAVELGVSKNFQSGFSTSVSAYSHMAILSAFPQEDATSGVKLSFGVDLLKNFLGKNTKRILDASSVSVQNSQLESDIRKKALFQSIRKIYWSLVANNESKLITTDLLEFSKKQAEEAKKRQKNSIADAGEVARYQSQYAARKGQLIYLNYQKETLVQQLKEILPELADKKIELGKYELEKTIRDVTQCTQIISSQTSIPYDYTKYDEILSLLTKQNQLLQDYNTTYSDWDLSLYGEVDSNTNKIGMSESLSNYPDEAKSAYALGLKLDIPLGSQIGKTEDIKKRLQQKRYEGQQRVIVGKLGAYHGQTVKNIFLLNNVIDAQVENTTHLKKSLEISKKKYDQARISVRDLINDQDLYLQSNLSEIDTKLAVITTLLNYFSVFTETPCNINK